MDLEKYLSKNKKLVDRYLLKCLSAYKGPGELLRAMRYSVMAPGKRIRPILVMAAAQACGGNVSAVMPVACAVELIHTFTLIHDDLPAIDNSPLRRGRPSAHKAFGEANAILAGDALLIFAYEVITKRADTKRITESNLLKIINELLFASSSVVGGEALDLEYEKKRVGAELIKGMYLKKTAALFRSALRCGALASGATSAQVAALSEYGEHVGFAFQVVDDLLDLTGDPRSSGKPTGLDKARGKATYPGRVGIAKAKQVADGEVSGALEALRSFGESAQPLREIAKFMIARNK